jgi:hypothetical protein
MQSQELSYSALYKAEFVDGVLLMNSRKIPELWTVAFPIPGSFSRVAAQAEESGSPRAQSRTTGELSNEG